MTTWFISDTHIGHKNLVVGTSSWRCKTGCRDFSTVEEHDSHLLNEINKRVKPDDVLWHLGDIAMGDDLVNRLKEIRARINCRNICLTRGNHDKILRRGSKHRENLLPLFKEVEEVKCVKVAGRMLFLHHFAQRTWWYQGARSIHLYGHSHGTLPDDPNSLSMDVGVDTCLFGHEKYTPYSEEEVFHIMDNHKKFVPVDHHNGDQ